LHNNGNQLLVFAFRKLAFPFPKLALGNLFNTYYPRIFKVRNYVNDDIIPFIYRQFDTENLLLESENLLLDSKYLLLESEKIGDGIYIEKIRTKKIFDSYKKEI
jgi:hypothetical protein